MNKVRISKFDIVESEYPELLVIDRLRKAGFNLSPITGKPLDSLVYTSWYEAGVDEYVYTVMEESKISH